MIRGGGFQFFRKELLKEGLPSDCAPLKTERNQSRDVFYKAGLPPGVFLLIGLFSYEAISWRST